MGAVPSIPNTGELNAPSKPRISDSLDFLIKIEGEQDWQKLCHQANNKSFAHVEVVKVILDVFHDNTLYFVNSKKWEFHHSFCSEVLNDETSKELFLFNKTMYSSENRKFCLGSILYYKDQDIYGLELAARDNLSGKRIKQFVDLVKNKVFFESKLKYKPISELHYTNIAQVDLPITENSILYAGVKYQPLTPGIVYGYLRLISENNDEKVMSVNPGDILVCNEIPIDIPPVGGLITGQLQTPLCHVALLCSNRQAPNMALIGATEHDIIKSADGKLVHLEVKLDDFEISVATTKEWKEWKKKKKKQNKIKKSDINEQLTFNVTSVGLLDFSSFISNKSIPSDTAKHYVGAKAAQLISIAKDKTLANSEEFKLNRNCLLHAFVIPFQYYHEHINEVCKSKLEQLIETKKSTKELRSEILKFQKAIFKQSEVLSSLVKNVMTMLQDWDATVLENCCGVIFRSSTNVEDIKGFNGAGLYESKAISIEDCFSIETVTNVILSVWASVWNYRGFEERKLFGIDQRLVQMAILVQPYYKKAVYCNGVAITAHPFRSDFDGHIVNVQLAGEKLITDNSGGTVAEQVLIWGYKAGPVGEKLTSSSLVKDGKDILDKSLITRLYFILSYLHHVKTKKGNTIYLPGTHKVVQTDALDVEFLILNGPDDDSSNKQIVLLQCRPFTKFYHHN